MHAEVLPNMTLLRERVNNGAKAPWVISIEADVWQRAIGAVVEEVGHAVLLNRLTVNAVDESSQAVLQEGLFHPAAFRVGIGVKADKMEFACSPLLHLLGKDVEHPRGLACHGVVLVLVLVYLQEHRTPLAVDGEIHPGT